MHRYAGDFEALYELRAVAGGVLEVDPLGQLTRWAVVNPYVADQGETAALAGACRCPGQVVPPVVFWHSDDDAGGGYETRASLAKAAPRPGAASRARGPRRTRRGGPGSSRCDAQVPVWKSTK